MAFQSERSNRSVTELSCLQAASEFRRSKLSLPTGSDYCHWAPFLADFMHHLRGVSSSRQATRLEADKFAKQ